MGSWMRKLVCHQIFCFILKMGLCPSTFSLYINGEMVNWWQFVRFPKFIQLLGGCQRKMTAMWISELRVVQQANIWLYKEYTQSGYLKANRILGHHIRVNIWRKCNSVSVRRPVYQMIKAKYRKMGLKGNDGILKLRANIASYYTIIKHTTLEFACRHYQGLSYRHQLSISNSTVTHIPTL